VNIRFLAVARQELDDAVDELDRVVRRIKSYPDSCRELAPGLRRALVSRFPYGIIYGRDADAVVVVAVAHLHREPRYWMSRASGA
jgi:plasmid stabilization system protein ParE